MKRTTQTLLLFFVPILSFAQIVNIPDANFKAALVGNNAINTNMDTEIQVTEAQAFSGAINVMGLGISDYTGLEAFTSITGFDGRFNDVSTIDVSNATNLVNLDLGANTAITGLDVSNNLLLETLNLAECFFIETVTFGNNTALTTLNLREAGTTNVDLSSLTALTDLDMNSTGGGTTPPSSIDFSNNTNLQSVTVRFSNVTSLDFSNNPNLTYVEVDFNNSMTDVNLQNGNNNILTTLIASDNPNLANICVDNVAFANGQAGWNPGGGTYTASCTLSVDNPTFDSLVSVYPNPTSDVIHVSLSNSKVIQEMILYDLSGKQLYAVKTEEMNVSSLSKGLYFLHIQADSGETSVRKILKN